MHRRVAGRGRIHSVRGRTDSVIGELAARQHGVVARSQLLEVGVPEHRIDYRLRCGSLTRLHRGVYSAGPLPGRLQREFAGVLAVGEGSFVSHRAAAAIHEMVPPLPARVPVWISTPRDVRIMDPGIRVFRVRHLGADEITTRDGLPLTTPARTLLDLAGVSDSRDLERALATALRKGLVDPAAITPLLDRYPRRAGRCRLRALLTADGGPAFIRSEAERRLLELVREYDLPRPRTNVIVEGFEVDFFWPEKRLVVEVDGRAYHAAPHAFERDHDRDGVLMAAGFRTLRVTWRQITKKRRSLIVRLAQALVR